MAVAHGRLKPCACAAGKQVGGAGIGEKMAAIRSRTVGSLLGLAVCDAVGTTVEFMPPGSFQPVTDMEGGGKFSLLSGQVGAPIIVLRTQSESRKEGGAGKLALKQA